MYTLYGSPSTAGTAIHWLLLELNEPFELRLLSIASTRAWRIATS
jgi:glutathione S-transferase